MNKLEAGPGNWASVTTMNSNYRGLDTVLVEKNDILIAIKENRDLHRAKFEEAMHGYKKRSIELLEDHIRRIADNAPEQVVISLPFPEDHTEDYDRVISQLEYSMDEQLELNEQEFNQYVRDQWGWQTAFAQTYAMYTE